VSVEDTGIAPEGRREMTSSAQSHMMIGTGVDS